MNARSRIPILTAILAASSLWLADRELRLDLLGPVWRRVAQASPPAETVLFVVLDTVRADRTSVCGHERPTTPWLADRVGAGASLACRAYTPGSWTMPTHASYFTNQPVPVHDVHKAMPGSDDAHEFIGSVVTTVLDDRLPTLAERLAERGYQTVNVSANPLVGPETGLGRGFEVSAVGSGNGHEIADRVRHLLRRRVARDRPLFLFVNLIDAHEPWAAIPDGVGWVPPRRGMSWKGVDGQAPAGPGDQRLIARWLKGEMDEREIAEARAHLLDVYDYGISLADAATAEIVDLLHGHGWAHEGLRVVVTSDHGEQFGEHGMVEHGRVVYEPVTRVPIIAWRESASGDVTSLGALPDPVNAVVVHDLALEGAAPTEPPPIYSVAFPDVGWDRAFGVGGTLQLAAWKNRSKLLWTESSDTFEAFDVVADPGELAPAVPGPDHEARPVYEQARRELEGATRVKADGGVDLTEQLKEIGYIE